MTQTAERLELTIFEKRMAADELLFELRAGGWKRLPPELLLELPTFQLPGGKGSSPPRYLTALLPPHPFFQNKHLEVSIMEQEYIDALREIDGLGYGEVWREFFATGWQLYWIVRQDNTDLIKRNDAGKVKGVTHTEVLTVRQNARTGRPERLCMNAIWKRAVVREYREDWAAF